MNVPVLLPDYMQPWMTDPRSWMVLLIVGIVAAILMWYRNYWVNAIGIVLNIALIAAWDGMFVRWATGRVAGSLPDLRSNPYGIGFLE